MCSKMPWIAALRTGLLTLMSILKKNALVAGLSFFAAAVVMLTVGTMPAISLRLTIFLASSKKNGWNAL